MTDHTCSPACMYDMQIYAHLIFIAYNKCNSSISWTLRKQGLSGVRPTVGRTSCHLLLFGSARTMCCPRQLFATLEFSSTAMSLGGLMCHVRCPDVSLCYDSSAASDAQCPILCSIRRACRWLCHGLTTAAQRSRDFLRLGSVDFSRFSMPPPDWYINLLGRSTSRRCCETCAGCGLQNASISSWLCSPIDACMA